MDNFNTNPFFEKTHFIPFFVDKSLKKSGEKAGFVVTW